MKYLFSTLLALSFCATNACLPVKTPQNSGADLEEKIGQLLVVGFVGTTPSQQVINSIEKQRVGGVILFDKNLTDKLPSGEYGQRNIESPTQLRKLTDSLQTLAVKAGLPKLFISIDQEGGLVNRLKSNYGFPATVSAKYQGNVDNLDTTHRYAAATAATLVAGGVNVNFAPCVDLMINPNNPIIAKVERSFGATSDLVSRHARVWIEEHNAAGLATTIKHFPGHGSSQDDSHLGLPDISKTWKEEELQPYRTLIGEGYNDIVMVGHLLCRQLDAEFPSSISKKTIAILRDSLHYQGVIATDCLGMKAIIDNYSLPLTLELALNGGVDMIVMGNNGAKFEADLVERTVLIIKGLVADGKVSEATINRAYDRMMLLKKRLNL